MRDMYYATPLERWDNAFRAKMQVLAYCEGRIPPDTIQYDKGYTMRQLFGDPTELLKRAAIEELKKDFNDLLKAIEEGREDEYEHR